MQFVLKRDKFLNNSTYKCGHTRKYKLYAWICTRDALEWNGTCGNTKRGCCSTCHEELYVEDNASQWEEQKRHIMTRGRQVWTFLSILKESALLSWALLGRSSLQVVPNHLLFLQNKLVIKGYIYRPQTRKKFLVLKPWISLFQYQLSFLPSIYSSQKLCQLLDPHKETNIQKVLGTYQRF